MIKVIQGMLEAEHLTMHVGMFTLPIILLQTVFALKRAISLYLRIPLAEIALACRSIQAVSFCPRQWWLEACSMVCSTCHCSSHQVVSEFSTPILCLQVREDTQNRELRISALNLMIRRKQCVRQVSSSRQSVQLFSASSTYPEFEDVFMPVEQRRAQTESILLRWPKIAMLWNCQSPW